MEAVETTTNGRKFERKVSSRGQTALPKPMRESLGIKVGDYVEFVETEPGNWVVRPMLPVHNPYRQAIGILKEDRHLKLSRDELLDLVRGPVE